jgi:hypothetical protein
MPTDEEIAIEQAVYILKRYGFGLMRHSNVLDSGDRILSLDLIVTIAFDRDDALALCRRSHIFEAAWLKRDHA